MMTVREVSRLAGVSVRTLQYYDTIGLLAAFGKLRESDPAARARPNLPRRPSLCSRHNGRWINFRK